MNLKKKLSKIFTLVHSPEFRFILTLESPDIDYECDWSTLSIGAFGHYVLIRLPKWVLKPTTFSGRTWLGQVTNKVCCRKYGITLFNDHLSLSYGRCTDDSDLDQQWSGFLPWMDRTLYRIVYFEGLNGTTSYAVDGHDGAKQEAIVKQLNKTRFQFKDQDGTPREATCYLYDFYYHRGTNWCRWLRFITKHEIYRRLDIDYNGEVGPGKGTFKGGTLSTSFCIDRHLHLESAFQTYAEKQGFTQIQLIK